MQIDKLALNHFDSPDDFARAMKLMYKSVALLSRNAPLEEYDEQFLVDMDELDDWLFEKAERFNKSIESEFTRLHQEIELLKTALKSTSSPSSAFDAEKLLSEISEKINPTLPDDQNPTLEELLVDWKDSNKNNLVQTSLENAYLPAIELFIRFANDFEGNSVRINQLKADHIRHYQKHYSKIPKGFKPSNYTIPQLIKAKGEHKSPKTVIDNYSNIATFLNWITDNGYPINSTLARVLTKGSGIRPDAKQQKQRLPFDNNDLTKLFNSEKYVKNGKFKTSGMYWAALISLLSGARMSEILQLERHDIQKVDAIWTFNFDDIDHLSTDDKKHVKKDGSRRLVPIHKQLIKLGFIEYVETRKDRLFPDELRNAKGKFDAFQKRHSTYRRQVDVLPSHKLELKDFHSFRHTVRTRLSDLRTTGHPAQRFDEGLIDSIIGHASQSRSIGQTAYNHSQYIKAKQKALNRLDYASIDFDSIIHWSKCEFTRVPIRKKAKAKNN